MVWLLSMLIFFRDGGDGLAWESPAADGTPAGLCVCVVGCGCSLEPHLAERFERGADGADLLVRGALFLLRPLQLGCGGLESGRCLAEGVSDFRQFAHGLVDRVGWRSRC